MKDGVNDAAVVVLRAGVGRGGGPLLCSVEARSRCMDYCGWLADVIPWC